MNLFVLDADPATCAIYHCDKHVVKMILEVAQLLCTTHHVLGTPDVPYRKTHVNHPCALWVRSGSGNYEWALDLGRSLCVEYTRRYGRRHKTQDVLDWCKLNKPLRLPEKPLEPFVQVMPPEYQGEDAVTAYRRYYIGEKGHIAKWAYSKNRIGFWTGIDH